MASICYKGLLRLQSSESAFQLSERHSAHRFITGHIQYREEKPPGDYTIQYEGPYSTRPRLSEAPTFMKKVPILT